MSETELKLFSKWAITVLILVSCVGLFEQYTENIYKNSSAVIEYTEIIESNLESRIINDQYFNKLQTSIYHYTKNKQLAEDYSRFILQASYEYELNPMLIFSVIAKESSFRSEIESSVGAIGLMQIMPFWKKEIGLETDNLKLAHTNIMYGCQILKLYIKQYGTKELALAAYNGSKGSSKYPNAVKSIYNYHLNET